MNIFQFIQSINKIAIVIFFLTGFSLIYEIYLFIKENKLNKTKPKIPSLTASGTPHFQKKLNLTLKREKKTLFAQPNNRAIIILIILLIVFGVLFIIGTITSKKSTPHTVVSPTPLLNMNALDDSEGIKIYTPSWQILGKNQLRFAKTGEMIIIGIKTIANRDITKARIRVNSTTWSISDETIAFNPQHKVFYQQHQIASDEALLKIEAELFSEENGWFGK
ncbi:MAG TPA: hypothetical protein VJB63_03100 [Patescibacteria group bacterium]|nr:hypothetical protein [Patescibacteria group bacterium]